MNPAEKSALRSIVRTAVECYAVGFQARHEGEVDNPEGTINMKIHNVFIDALGEEVKYYNALSRSLDSSLGNMLEKLAINIAERSFTVRKNVEGPLSSEQTAAIADLLDKYKARENKPSLADYGILRDKRTTTAPTRQHKSDYYLKDEATDTHYLIELKIGGDLDNKKARSEKEAIFEQYAILSNTLPPGAKISAYFATAYNRYGEGAPWGQERVKQFFAPEELLIGKDFWNFICQSQDGYDIVIEAYRESAKAIKDALQSIKERYLG